jgi:hypothetical protein
MMGKSCGFQQNVGTFSLGKKRIALKLSDIRFPVECIKWIKILLFVARKHSRNTENIPGRKEYFDLLPSLQHKMIMAIVQSYIQRRGRDWTMVRDRTLSTNDT